MSTSDQQTKPNRYALSMHHGVTLMYSGVIHRSMAELLEGIGSEMEFAENEASDGEVITFTVTKRCMSDAEMDALPEWTGP